jgi:hypothetical protein
MPQPSSFCASIYYYIVLTGTGGIDMRNFCIRHRCHLPELLELETERLSLSNSQLSLHRYVMRAL